MSRQVDRVRSGFIAPNTMICGVIKGGSVMLWGFLEEQPEALMAKEKELHFLDFDTNYRQGLTSWLC